MTDTNKTSLARLARFHAIHDAQAPQLDFIQRSLRGDISEADKVEDPRDIFCRLSDTSVAVGPGGQSLFHGLARDVGKQITQVCERSLDAVMNGVVDMVEDRIRPTMQALHRLSRSPANALDSPEVKEPPLETSQIEGGDSEGPA